MSTMARRAGKGPGTSRKAGAGAGAGVVRACLLGTLAAAGIAGDGGHALVSVVEAGLPFGELEALRGALAVPADRLAPMLGMSRATFHRRRGAGARLTPSVSDRVVRYARLLGAAGRVFGGIEPGKLWLAAPQAGLGGAVPLDFARTEVGAREVEDLLGRIEHGVYA